MSVNLKVYGYIILIQLVAFAGYMQLNVGKPKDESYWLGAFLVVGNGFLNWLGRSPTNPIKTFQAPNPKDILEGEGKRGTDKP